MTNKTKNNNNNNNNNNNTENTIHVGENVTKNKNTILARYENMEAAPSQVLSWLNRNASQEKKRTSIYTHRGFSK